MRNVCYNSSAILLAFDWEKIEKIPFRRMSLHLSHPSFVKSNNRVRSVTMTGLLNDNLQITDEEYECLKFFHSSLLDQPSGPNKLVSRMGRFMKKPIAFQWFKSNGFHEDPSSFFIKHHKVFRFNEENGVYESIVDSIGDYLYQLLNEKEDMFDVTPTVDEVSNQPIAEVLVRDFQENSSLDQSTSSDATVVAVANGIENRSNESSTVSQKFQTIPCHNTNVSESGSEKEANSHKGGWQPTISLERALNDEEYRTACELMQSVEHRKRFGIKPISKLRLSLNQFFNGSFDSPHSRGVSGYRKTNHRAKGR